MIRTSSIRKSIGPMSEYERLVNEVLLTISSEYILVEQPESISFEMDLFKYRPDFEIINEFGKKLFIEVKSEFSMSLPNMVNFVKIDRAIRRDPYKGLLILVFGDSTRVKRFAARPEFDQLNIRYVNNSFDVLNVVQDELKNLFG